MVVIFSVLLKWPKNSILTQTDVLGTI